MSCSQLVLPQSDTPFEAKMRKHFMDLITSQPKDFGAVWSDWIPSKPIVISENVLLDDAFISDMRSTLAKQLTEEQIENLRGKTASRILVSKEGSEYSITLEF